MSLSSLFLFKILIEKRRVIMESEAQISDEEFEEMILMFIVHRRRRKRRLKQIVKKVQKPRKFWVRNIFQERENLGEYHRLSQKLKQSVVNIFSGK